jgi:hypothetical protein
MKYPFEGIHLDGMKYPFGGIHLDGMKYPFGWNEVSIWRNKGQKEQTK